VSIVPTDIVMRLTTTAGAAGDSTAGTPAGSLGKYASTTVLTPATLQNMFDNVTGAESAAGRTEYRAGAILNNHATLTLTAATLFIASETAGGGAITVASDNIAASAKGAASAQLTQIASETTAPTGVSAFGSSCTLGDIGPGQVKGFWMKRVVTAGATAVPVDGVILEVDGDTL
jgi:hypothetical protein